MSGLGAFAGGMSEGLRNGVGIGRMVAGTNALDEETEYRRTMRQRQQKEMEDIDYIQGAQSKAALKAKSEGVDESEIPLIALTAGKNAARERNRWDIESQFHAADDQVRRGLTSKYLDTAIRMQDPSYVGKAFTVLSGKPTTATGNPDGSLTIDDGESKQTVAAGEVQNWMAMVRDPNAWMNMRAKIAEEERRAAREVQGKIAVERAKGEEDRKTDAQKYRDPRQQYMTIKGAEGEGETLVNVGGRSPAVVGGPAQQADPTEAFDETDRAYSDDFQKMALRDFGTEGGADPANPFGAKRMTDPEGKATRVARNASDILKGSAVAKGKYLISSSKAYEVASDVERGNARVAPGVYQDEKGNYWEAPTVIYGDGRQPLRLGGGVKKQVKATQKKAPAKAASQPTAPARKTNGATGEW